MRNKKTQTMNQGLADIKKQYQAELEIQNFLKAIHSYAERFAQNPDLSFDDHLFTITAQNENPHFA